MPPKNKGKSVDISELGFAFSVEDRLQSSVEDARAVRQKRHLDFASKSKLTDNFNFRNQSNVSSTDKPKSDISLEDWRKGKYNKVDVSSTEQVKSQSVLQRDTFGSMLPTNQGTVQSHISFQRDVFGTLLPKVNSNDPPSNTIQRQLKPEPKSTVSLQRNCFGSALSKS